MSALHAHQDENITSFDSAWLIDVRPLNRAALLHIVYSLPQMMMSRRGGGGWWVSIWSCLAVSTCKHSFRHILPYCSRLTCLHPTPDRSCSIFLLTMSLFLPPHDAYCLAMHWCRNKGPAVDMPIGGQQLATFTANSRATGPCFRQLLYHRCFAVDTDRWRLGGRGGQHGADGIFGHLSRQT